MSLVVRTRIVKIGNSQGVRIPKFLLEQTALRDEVELELQSGQIIIRSPHQPRRDWDAAFAEMSRRGDDALLDGDALLSTDWDEEEWEW